MRFAYADPPYLGCCGLYGHEHGETGDCWDDPETHFQLFRRLYSEYPDGWALSASSSSLSTLLQMGLTDIRVMAWVKPFAAFKKNNNPSYAWEPIIVSGGRTRSDEQGYMRDWVAENITLKKGLTGAKPQRVCWWIFDVLGAQPGDNLDDLYPGTGIVTEAWSQYLNEYPAWASHINRVSASWEPGKHSTAA